MPTPKFPRLTRRIATFAAALAVVAALASVFVWRHAQAATILWSSAGGSAWLTGANWTSGSVPGAADVAQFGVNPTASTSSVGINMNGSTNNGANNQAVGAIDILNTRTNPIQIGNSSSTAAGTLTLNGATVVGTDNVIIQNNSAGLLTIQAQQSSNSLMGLALGNATDNIILLNGSQGVAITSVISGANRKLTLQGAGTGTLTLGGNNTYSGDTTINTNKLALVGTVSIANSPNIVISGNGTFDVSGLTASSFDLAGGQGFKATGTTSNGVLAMGTKNIVMAPNSPLQFTAFNGATAPLSTGGTTGTLNLAGSNPVTVTTTTVLGVGSYTLIAKASGGGVAGTAPTSVTVNGGGLAPATTASLSITGGDLVLNVALAPAVSLKYRSKQTGNWNAASTWETSADGTTWIPAVSTPTSADDVITVQNTHTVTVTANVNADQLTVNSGGTLSVNNGVTFTVDDGAGTDATVDGTLATAGIIANNGQAQVNNTLRIDEGGFPGGGTGTYSYQATTGTLVFNNSTGPYGVNNDSYWPTSNGPQNVTVQNTGGIHMNAARTVGRTFQYAAGVNGAGNLTLNGTSQVNTGGFASGSPTYGAASQLVYNTGGTYGRNGEWLPGATSGAGYPANVRIGNNTTLDLPGSGAANNSPFQLAGGLTIDPGSALSMGAMAQALTVVGSVTNNGTLTLSTASGGDIKLGGDWTRGANAAFTPNGRAVVFNGGEVQLIIVSGGGTETFSYLVMDKPDGALVLGNDVGQLTDVVVNATAGDALQLLNGPGINLAGRTLTMSGDGGNLLAAGDVREIVGGTLAFTGTKTVTSASGGTLSFHTTANVNLSDGVDFGAGISTVNGKLSIKSGGFVNTNPPNYDVGSTLEYDNGATYDAAAEFPATGVQNVTLASTTLLSLDGSKTVPGTLALGANKIATGAHTLAVGGSGALTRTTGYVVGNLRKTFTAAGAKTFEVGTADGYSPVAVNATAGTFPAAFTAAAAQGKHPSISGANALARYWTLDGSGITANLTFNYLAADAAGTEANYKIFKRSGGTFTQFDPTALDTTNHAATLNGVSSFSDWTLAEAPSVFGEIRFAQANTDDGETNADHTVNIAVQRAGGGSSGAVSVTYTVTDGTTNPATAGTDYSISPATGTLTWADGDTEDKQITINVKGDTAFEPDETVSLTLSDPQGGASLGSPSAATLTITNDDPEHSDISVSKADSHDPATVGNTLTYTITVSNAGQAATTASATGVAVTDTLPAGVAFQSASSGCSESNGTITCGLPDIPAGGSASVLINVVPNAPGQITNDASATAANDPTPPQPVQQQTTVVAAECTAPPAGMVLWHPADGNANDLAGANHGTLQNGATFAAGKVNQAYSLDGTNDYVEAADFMDLSAAGVEMTIDAWIRRASAGSGDVIASKWNATSPADETGWIFGINDSDKFYWLTSVSGVYQVWQSSGTFTDTTSFRHVALTVRAGDASSVKVYLDGVEMPGSFTSGNGSQVPGDTNWKVVIGATICASCNGPNAPVFDSFNGAIDEVEIFNRILSPAEILSLHNAGSAGKCRSCAAPPVNMVAWWRAEGDASDRVGANDGAPQGGAAFAAGEVGQAFNFTGAGQSVVAPHRAEQNTGAQITVDAWINPTSLTTANASVINKRTAANQEGYTFELGDNANSLNFEITTSEGVFTANAAGALTANVWQHVAATYDGSAIRVYVNGTLRATAAATGAINAVNADLVVGRNVVTGASFPGRIDEVELFDRALTQPEIARISNAQGEGKCDACAAAPAGLSAWYTGDNHAEDIQGPTFEHGTPQGGVAYAAGVSGRAFQFDGTDDAVTTTLVLDYSNGASLDAWIRTADADAGVVVADGGGSTARNGMGLFVEGGAARLYGTNGAGLNFLLAGANVADGNWHHVAGTWTGTAAAGGVRLYVDGAEVATGAAQSTVAGGTTPFAVGGDPPGGIEYNNFAGLIDEVEIFSRALPAEEVRSVYSAGIFGKCRAARAFDDSYVVGEDGSLTAPAPGVLANDNDGNLDTLTPALVDGPDHAASFTFNPDGSFSYTPNANFHGADTFTYKVNDGTSDSNTATVTITVNPVNDPPSGADKTVTTNEDTPYTFAAADFGFTDPNDSPANSFLAVKITTLPLAGTLTNNNAAVNAGDFVPVSAINGGSFKFTPVANANGTPYASFTFQVQDDGNMVNGDVDLDPTPNTMTVNVTAVDDTSFTVTKTADTNTACAPGDCSLREAISAANADPGAEEILFNIPATDPGFSGGVFTIRPTPGALPTVTGQISLDGATQTAFGGDTNPNGPEVVINGGLLSGSVNGLVTSPAAANSTISNLVVNGFTNGAGVGVWGNGIAVMNNYLGTDATGASPVPNAIGLGVGSSSGNSSGYTVSGNLISGNSGPGVNTCDVTDSNFSNNKIGTDRTGAGGLGNGNRGMQTFCTNFAGNHISNNIIAFNTGHGFVDFPDFSGTSHNHRNNRITGNSFFSNTGLGINLNPPPDGTDDGVTANDAGDGDTGSNNLQNFPVLSWAATGTAQGATTAVAGTLNSTPSTTFTVEFFSSPACDASGNGEGQTYIGALTNVLTDAGGNASFTFTSPSAVAVGQFVTATATDPAGNTSEFSACRAVASTGSIQFSSATYAVAENGTQATVTVVRTGGVGGAVSATFNTSNGTATAGSDYTAVTSYTVSFADGDAEETVTIPVTDNTVYEGDETVNLALSNPQGGAALGPQAAAVLTITENDPPPVFTIDDVTRAEGNSGQVAFTFTIIKGGATALGASVDYATADGTAQDDNPAAEDNDYAPASGTHTFAANETVKTVTVLVNGDTAYEGNETFFVNLSNPSNATVGDAQGTGTITNDDAPSATLVVNTTADTDDGACLPAPSTCTLREAINAANLNADANTINFDLPAGDARHLYYVNDNVAGQVTEVLVAATTAADDTAIVNIDPDWPHSWWSIRPGLGGLPSVTNVATINGHTQPTASANTNATGALNAVLRVELNGSAAGAGADGLRFITKNSTARGLSVNRFLGDGVVFKEDVDGSNDGDANAVRGCYVGTDASGTLDVGNGGHGVTTETDNPSHTSDNNHVGGIVPADRSLISGNNGNGVLLSSSSGNFVRGNIVGLAADGATALGNGAHGVEIGGSTVGGDDAADGAADGTVAARNVISANGGSGVRNATGASVVRGNYVGTDASGTLDRGNAGAGVFVVTGLGMSIGGATAGAANVISGNDGDGVQLSGNSNVVQGNFIGTRADGTTALPNGGSGVNITGGVTVFNTVGGTGAGEANRIAFNGADGVRLDPTAGVSNTVRGNSIYSNGTTSAHLGIDLGADGVTPNDANDADTGPNALQNFPVIAAATVTGATNTVRGTLNSTPNQTFTLDFYSNASCDTSGSGEGATHIGSTTAGPTDASGNASFRFHPASLATGQVITATATSATGSTSEFSQCATVVAGTSGAIQFVSSTYTVAEGGGSVSVTFARAGGSDGAVFANFSTADGSAAAGSDYTSTSMAVSYADGETGTKTVNVPVLDDTAAPTFEGDETVNLRLTATTIDAPPAANAPTPLSATLTITENDAAPVFSIGDVTQAEGDAGATTFTFTVTKTGATALGASVDYATSDGTATAGSDYTAVTATTLTFAASETQKQFTVSVGGDGTYEANETFFVNLSNPSNATVGDGQATGTITNDDAPPATLVVNTTDDNDDGFCLASHCSLREAINAANANPDANTINFNIPNTDAGFAGGVFTIKRLTGEYALSSGSTTIDGTSQAAFTGDTNTAGPEVVIDGSLVNCGPSTCNGFAVNSANNTIRGLVINNFTAHGITMFGGGTGNTIRGNYIGTDPTGTTAAGNAAFGITSPGGNTIGGSAEGEGNLVSGNGFGSASGFGGISLGTGDTVKGNKIGTNAAGTAAIANKPYGIVANSGGHTIEGNLISGNAGAGIAFFNSSTDSNTLKGNKIGTNAAGTSAVANTRHGVELCCGAGNNTVGGTAAGEPNVIAFNGGAGVSVHGLPSASNGANGNRIVGNSIHSNTGLGIDLGNDGVTPNDPADADADPDANNLQNSPALTSATVTGSTRVVAGTLNSTPGQTFTVDFYTNDACDTSGSGEGKTHVGSLTTNATDSNGDVSFAFNYAGLSAGQIITATATDAAGNTSEFSQCRTVVSGAAGEIRFTSASYAVSEADGTAAITVERVGGSDGQITATFSTSDGTATSPADYTAVAGQAVTFNDGETGMKTVSVQINQDALYEGDETVSLSLSSTAVNSPVPLAAANPRAATLTITDDEAKPAVSIAGPVYVSEPESGTASATFTVTLSNPAAAPVTVTYQTADGTAAAPGDYTAVPPTVLTFAAEDTSETITVAVKADALPEGAEQFLVNLSSPSANATLGTASAAGVIADFAAEGSLIISELRARGAGGATDEYVELYNNTDRDIHVATLDGTAGWSLAALSADGTTVVPLATIPAGEIIPARSHYLIANGPAEAASPAGGDASPSLVAAGDYSLGAYAAPDLTFQTDIPDGGGVALFRTADTSGFSTATRFDAVGFNALAGPTPELFREGTPLQSPGANDGQYAFVRGLTTGRPADTGNNAADFRFVSTDGGTYGGVKSTLGAPGPEGGASPVQRNQIVKATLINSQVDFGAPPNTVRKQSCAPGPDQAEECDPNRSAQGTFSIRRRWTNRTGRDVTQLRFRIVDVTTLNSPGYSAGGAQADLRAISSGDVVGGVQSTNGTTVQVQGTTLEAPSSAPLGGGLNSTLAAGTVTVSDPLVPDESINLQFLFGVQQAGGYRLFVNVEAVEAAPPISTRPARSKSSATQPKAAKPATKQ